MPPTAKEALIDKERLRHKVSLLPRLPGVYLFRNEKGEVVYVGKAKSLANRVRSYFVENYDDGRKHIHALVRSIADLEYISTGTEAEALVLEATLVKRHAPRYNVRLKDDKKYPYLMLTNEDYPRLVYTRDLRKGAGRYFGPYTDAKAARRTGELLHRLFPIRTCAPPLPSKSITRVCMQYEIKRCKGPCVGLESKEDYVRTVDQAERFLRGQVSAVVDEIEEAMAKAAAGMEFERAAEYRDQLRDIHKVSERQTLSDAHGESRDVIAVARDDTEAVAVVMEIREGKLIARKDHSLTVGLDEPVETILGAFLRQYYLDAVVPPPRQVDVMARPDDAEALTEWLEQLRGGKVVLHFPQRGDKVRLVGMARQNASMLLTERRIRREKMRDRIPHAVSALQRDLRLDKVPRRIACFDISHIQGTDTVGSMVVFQDGKPLKSAYRTYNIRSLAGDVGSADDFAAMREVIGRQFRQREDGADDDRGDERPDLIVVDGGKGQLSSAKATLEELGASDQPVIGLAKRLEEVFLPGLSDAQTMPRTSSGLKLLQQIRDEAHRFAIKSHRRRRGKSVSASALDEIDGVGPARKRELLKRFKSVSAIAAASVDEIASVSGMGPAVAKAVKEALSGSG